MLSQQTDYLQIDVVAYDPGGIVNSPNQDGGARKNSNKKSEKTILLPIPSNISDTNSVKYDSSSLNSIAGAAVGAVMRTMESGTEYTKDGNLDLMGGMAATGNAIREGASDINAAVGGLGETKGFITRFLASKAVGLANINITPEQILARSEGKILNPNMELLFNGPGLRSFRFQFKLTPRGPKERNEVEAIIRTFKKHMSPKVSPNGAFLNTPDIFELRYRKGNSEHPFLNKFKQCFLSSVNVNYTGEGTYATYDDGTPVSMTMDLSFQEIEPIYDTDYGEYKVGSGVGY